MNKYYTDEYVGAGKQHTDHTVNEWLNILDKELIRLDELKAECDRTKNRTGKSNIPNSRKKMELCQQMLLEMNLNTVIRVEGCRGDGEIRDFVLANAGSLVECAVKYYYGEYDKENNFVSKNFGKGADFHIGAVAYECKASLVANSKCTPPTEERVMIFVNKLGAMRITKADVKVGERLCSHVLYGTYNKALSKALGF